RPQGVGRSWCDSLDGKPVDTLTRGGQRKSHSLVDPASQPHVEREIARTEDIIGRKHAHEMLRVAAVFERFVVRVGSKISTELEPGLRHDTRPSKRRVDRQTAVETLALDRPPALDERFGSAVDGKYPFSREEGRL